VLARKAILSEGHRTTTNRILDQTIGDGVGQKSDPLRRT
jgi:hypothetical protein